MRVRPAIVWCAMNLRSSTQSTLPPYFFNQFLLLRMCQRDALSLVHTPSRYRNTNATIMFKTMLPRAASLSILKGASVRLRHKIKH